MNREAFPLCRALPLCSIVAMSAAIIVFFFGSAIPADAGLSDVWLLEPGRSFGAISVGSSLSDLQKMLGEPDRKKEVQNGVLMKYDKPGIIVQVGSMTNAVQFVGTDRAANDSHVYKTKDGLAVGKSRAEVEKIYGPPASVIPCKSRDFYPLSEQVVLYVSKGIAFHYDAKGAISVILIFDSSIFSR